MAVLVLRPATPSGPGLRDVSATDLRLPSQVHAFKAHDRIHVKQPRWTVKFEQLGWKQHSQIPVVAPGGTHRRASIWQASVCPHSLQRTTGKGKNTVPQKCVSQHTGKTANHRKGMRTTREAKAGNHLNQATGKHQKHKQIENSQKASQRWVLCIAFEV